MARRCGDKRASRGWGAGLGGIKAWDTLGCGVGERCKQLMEGKKRKRNNRSSRPKHVENRDDSGGVRTPEKKR